MKIEFTPGASEGVERHIQVSVPAEDVKDAEDKAARRYASTVRLPGFRPGKAPATVVRKKFGEAIRQEALETIVREAYQEFVEKESIKVAAQPHIHDLKFEEGKPLTFELHLEVRPTIELTRTNGFRIQRDAATVTDEQLNEQLEQIRDEKATWTPVAEKPKPGDMVNVQIATGAADKDAGEGKSYPLVLGAGQAILLVRREVVEELGGGDPPAIAEVDLAERVGALVAEVGQDDPERRLDHHGVPAPGPPGVRRRRHRGFLRAHNCGRSFSAQLHLSRQATSKDVRLVFHAGRRSVSQGAKEAAT